MSATQPVVKPIAVKLGPEVRARIKALAEARDRSLHWLMREAIAQYVEREEHRESFRQDALRAWTAYQTSGAHVTAQDADAWLARLEAGEDAESPKARS